MNINTSLREKIFRFFNGINKRLLFVAALFFITIAGGATYYFVSAASPISGTTVKISKDSSKLYFGINGSDKYTYRYNVTYTSGEDNEGNTRQTYEAVCAETDKNTPDGMSSSAYDLSQEISATKYEQIKRVLLTTYIGRNYSYNGTNAYNDTVFDWSAYSRYANGKGKKDTSVALGHVLVSYIYSGSTTGFSDNFARAYWAGSNGLIQEIYNRFENDPDLKALAEHVILRRSEGKSGSKDNQDLIWMEGVRENPEGELGIVKSSTDTDLTDGNSYYQLSNAVFDIYRDDQCTGNLLETDSEDGTVILENAVCTGAPVATVTTGSDGKTSPVTVPIGFYYVKEKTSPRGFRLNSDVYGNAVIDGDTVWLDIYDDPIVGGVKIKKVDSETLAIQPQGGASLSGAKFALYNASQVSPTPITSDITIGANGYAEYDGLAPGRYKILEVTPGTGYLLNNNQTIEFTIGSNLSDGGVVDLSGDPFTNQVIRGDFKFTKYAKNFEGTSVKMSGVPFLITSQNGDVPPEQHVIVSDANGVVDTSAHRCNNVNANDSIIQTPTSQWGNIVSSSLDQNAGVWFGGNKSAANDGCLSNASGALPYGTYTVQELKISDNDAYTPISFSVTISSNGVKVDLGNKTNTFEDNPSLSTLATGSDGTSKTIDIGTSVAVNDKVTYSGLTSGVSYSLTATLYDQNGNVVINGGNPVTGSASFTAGSNGSGTVNVPITLNTSAYAGQNLSVFQELYRKGTKIAEHNKNLSDANQTVKVRTPYITSSTATASDGTSKNVGVGIETIIDKVTLFGLVNGNTYNIKTTAKTASGDAVKLLSGNSEVNSIQTAYTHSGTTGGSVTVTTTLKIDTTKYKSTDIVIYQELLEANGTSLSVHPNSSSTSAQIAAETVTVKTPEIHTDAYSGSGAELNNDEISVTNHASIRDRVKVSGLVKDTTYTLTGKVVSVDNTNVVLATATITKTMTATSGEEYWYMDFDVNTFAYAGKQLVIFEYLSRDGVELAKHEDKNDTNQVVTVKSVGIETNAENADISGSKEVGIGLVNIKDTVTYWGLVDGDTYILSAQLIRKDNNTVVAEAVGDPFSANSTATTSVIFHNVDTSNLIGKQIVVVERLYKGSSVGSDDNKVAEHVSLDDTNQTITVKTPTLATVAWNTNKQSDNTEKKLLRVGGNESITDTIQYSGLVAGQVYNFTACLYDGTTKEQIAGTTCRSEDKTVASSSGTIDILIGTINTYNLIGKKVVVKETVKYNNTVVAEHDVLKSGTPSEEVAAQTVTVKTPTLATVAWNTNKQSDNTEKKLLRVGGNESITDTIQYSGLISGQTYTFTACLYDGDTNELITGTECRSEDATLTSDDGSFDLLIGTINTYNLIGKKVVVKETVKYNNTVVAEHDVLKSGTPSEEVAAQTVTVKTPTLATVAWNTNERGETDEKNLNVGYGESISDTITYTGLISGQTYRFTACIFDGTTKAQITGKLSKGGTSPSADCQYEDKTLSADSGSVDVFVGLIDTFDLIGKKIVVRETVSYNGVVIATHDVFQEGTPTSEVNAQTLTVKTPEVGTVATDKFDNDTSLAVGTVTIKDLVHYSGLKPGEEYTLDAKLVDENGRELSETYENLIYNTTNETFAADASGEGDVVVEITLDDTAKLRANGVEKVTIYEYLLRNDNQIAKHEELNGTQTLDILEPTIETDAVSGSLVEGNGDKVVAINTEARIIDTVKYTGLSVGTSYKVTGKLYDQISGSPLLINGHEVTAEKEFTAETEEGEVELIFVLDTTKIPGKDLVAFEQLLSKDGIEIAKHEEIDDLRQWVEVQPRVGTKVVDTIDGDQAVGVGIAHVDDTVHYEGLRDGKDYLLVGTLMDRKTGEPIKHTVIKTITPVSECAGFVLGEGETMIECEEGDTNGGGIAKIEVEKPISGETKFKIGDEGTEEIDGYVKVSFEFDSTGLQGRELVIYEELYKIVLDDEGEVEESLLIAEHKDLEDEEQFIDVKTVKIGTTAVDAKDGDKELDLTEDEKVLDVVEYYGLVKGDEYRLVGELINKETGESLGVKKELDFKATGESGVAELEFGIDASELSGKEIVAFETLYYLTDGDDEEDEPVAVEIAEHKDLNDQKQTVWVKVLIPNTGMFGAISQGAMVSKITLVSVAMGALGAVYAVISRKRKMRF